MNTPKIEYPCQWSYRVIGTCEQQLRQAAAQCIDVETTVSLGNQSSGNKYISLNLSLWVESEAMRDRIFAALQGHPAVKFIL